MAMESHDGVYVPGLMGYHAVQCTASAARERLLFPGDGRRRLT